MASRTTSVRHAFVSSKWITWAVAWTPVSVRPATCTRAASPLKPRMARSSAPCTEGAVCCSWKPLNGPPSYSMVSL